MNNVAWFRKLAVTTLLISYLLIIVGGIVRVEGAGMGCGDDWPVCNGEVIPTFSYLTALEYSHRVIAGVVLLLSTMLMFVGWRLRHIARWFLVLPAVALGLVIAQALLGAVTVFVELDAAVVTAHLGMAQSYFGLMILIALLAHWQVRAAGISGFRPGSFGWISAVAAGAVLVLMLTGAYTATSPAAWACPEWPGCNGYYFPAGTAPVDVHLLHRWTALLALLAVFAVTVQARRLRPHSPMIVGLTALATTLMVVQVFVGAMNIWFKLSSWVGVTHLGLATIVWGALAATFMISGVVQTRGTINVGETDSVPRGKAQTMTAG